MLENLTYLTTFVNTLNNKTFLLWVDKQESEDILYKL